MGVIWRLIKTIKPTLIGRLLLQPVLASVVSLEFLNFKV